MSEPSDASDNIPDDLVDIAYEAMTNELDHWRIVGPDATGTFVALRDEQIQMKMAATAIIQPANPIPNLGIINYRMKDKRHAVACLQWHALKAALAAVKGELGPVPSNTEAPSTGEIETSTSASSSKEKEA